MTDGEFDYEKYSQLYFSAKEYYEPKKLFDEKGIVTGYVIDKIPAL